MTKQFEINKSTSNNTLISRLEFLVRTERKITHQVLLHIMEVEVRRLYANLGYDSMFSYLTRGLNYSESAAYRRLQSARLLKNLDKSSRESTIASLEEGKLNLSQLSMVQKELRLEKSKENVKSNQAKSEGLQCQNLAHEILTKLENKNTFETQKILSQEFNKPIEIKEVKSPQSDDSVTLTINFSKSEYEELQKAQSLLSHVVTGSQVKDLILLLARKATQKAQSSQVKKQLLMKAHFQCEYQDPVSKNKCGSKYQLQIDHIQPKAYGGLNDLQNLRVLCRTHNLLAAEKAGLSRR